MNNETKIVQIIKEEYENRLLKVYRESVKDILESSVVDGEGNILLSPGLKVRHKSSGYEYTVDHVEGKGDNVVVFLRHPEAPRFNPPDADVPINEGEDEQQDKDPMLSQIDVSGIDYMKVSNATGLDDELKQQSNDPMDDAKKQASKETLKVSMKEFEKEYEVK